MAEMEQTLVIAKPDAVQRGLVGEVLGRFERRGLQLVACQMLRVDRALAEEHYAEHRGKPFFAGLVSFITSSPVVAAVFAGPGAITLVRATIGSTNPANAPLGTIRGDFALDVGRLRKRRPRDRPVVRAERPPRLAAHPSALARGVSRIRPHCARAGE